MDASALHMNKDVYEYEKSGIRPTMNFEFPEGKPCI